MPHIHPVCITIFAPQRAQPLERLSITYQTKSCPGHQTLGTNIVQEIRVIRIGCTKISHWPRRWSRSWSGESKQRSGLYCSEFMCFVSGGTTCLTLLVKHRCSSKVVNNAANSISHIRQAMPQKTHEAVSDKQRQPSSATQFQFIFACFALKRVQTRPATTVNIYIYIYIYAQVCVCIYVYMYTQVCVCIYIYIYVYVRVYT